MIHWAWLLAAFAAGWLFRALDGEWYVTEIATWVLQYCIKYPIAVLLYPLSFLVSYLVHDTIECPRYRWEKYTKPELRHHYTLQKNGLYRCMDYNLGSKIYHRVFWVKVED